VTAAEIVEANDKETLGIHGLAWPDAGIPPTGFWIIVSVNPGGMMVSRKRMAN
jgi:hypothetical protein